MESPPRTNGPKPAGRARRGPKKVTPQHLENVALHYLARFATSAENLRRVLARRVEKSARHHGTDPDEGLAWIEDLIKRYRRAGLLDDGAFAEARAADLLRRGVPVRGIRFRLAQKGVGGADIDKALDVLVEDQPAPDLAAAVSLARRRRLGPFSPAAVRAERREKDLAALARAGFDYDTARRVIDAETPDDLEAIMAEGRAAPTW